MSAVLNNNNRAGDAFAGGPPREPSGGKQMRQDPLYADFYGRNFLVTEDVLIPCPETEQLIDAVLKLAGKPYLPGVKPTPRILPEHPVILDVGTGSGCIAITLALELPEAKVSALDISEKALSVASKNAANLGAKVYPFIISHLLENVKFTPDNIPDVIVANLPYVDPNWDWLDKEALSKEPSLALYADDHGLALIKSLIDQSVPLPTPFLILEADPCQHKSIIEYASKSYKLRDKMGFILVLEKH